MIRVLVADDQVMVREGFAALLTAQPDIEVVGHVSDGLQAVAVARSSRPDVVLMDVRMPRMDGLEATRMIVADGSARVLMLTTFDRLPVDGVVGHDGYLVAGSSTLAAVVEVILGR